ncbi:glycosyltransferase 87 family protein [Hamadaea sp. NPDC051192]|uniref:glycosyltransferase 87 family protein n=1 Tax=Hamadaea sp. NPDC051192 TaxID=3154940 RepID=UPI00342708F9
MIKRAVYTALAIEIVALVVFTVLWESLDFSVYMWGGQAVASDARLYTEQALAHWFTYSPFAALVFAPWSVLPLTLGRLLWQLLSVAAFAGGCAVVMRLAGRPVTRLSLAMAVAAGLLLEPVYHTLFQAQINLLLFGMILLDVWLVSRGRFGGVWIGVAAAIKLTPAIFIVFLLVAGRTRAAATAVVTFVSCGLLGLLVAPEASRMYWLSLFFDTSRVGAPYISNQSPYGMLRRLFTNDPAIDAWYPVIPAVIGLAGLVIAARLARRGDWLAAVAATGVTGLLVSPISWAHHWVWVVPALAVLLRGGRAARIAAAVAYAVFVLAPMWWTPRFGGPGEYGWHGWVTAVANCFLLCGLGFLAYAGRLAALPAVAEPAVEVAGTERERAIAI